MGQSHWNYIVPMMICTAFLTLVIFTSGLYMQDTAEACPCGQDRKCNSRGGKCYLKECPNYLYPIGACRFKNKDCKDCVCCAHREDPVDPVDTAEACPCGQDRVCNKKGGKCCLKECPNYLYPIGACRFGKDCKDCVCCVYW